MTSASPRPPGSRRSTAVFTTLFFVPSFAHTVTEQSAELSRAMHPHRLQYEMFSDNNPLMRPIAAAAEAGARESSPG